LWVGELLRTEIDRGLYQEKTTEKLKNHKVQGIASETHHIGTILRDVNDRTIEILCRTKHYKHQLWRTRETSRDQNSI
jgi:hypothetical protein